MIKSNTMSQGAYDRPIVGADLVRLEDILEELRTNVRSLKYQMAKARRYQIIRDRIRGWEIVHLRRQLGELLAERRGADGAVAKLIELTKTEDTSLAGLERRVEEARAAHLELEKERTELQNGRYELRRRIETSEGKIIQFTERQSQARVRVEKARREIEESEKRLAGIAERSADVGRHAAETEALAAAAEEAVAGFAGEHGGISERIRLLGARLMDAKQTHLDFLQEEVRAKSALEHYGTMLSELDARSAETRERIAGTERESAGIAAGKERAAEVCRGLEERNAGLERERLGLVDAMREAEQRLLDGERGLAGKRVELDAVRSRHDLLRRMKENF